VLHCFSAPPERVAEAVAHGWFCSFAGNLTYPKAAELREASRLVPDQLILVETDSPFLAPQSRRGKRNEPALVVETAREAAAARGMSYEDFEELVEANAGRVFAW
jgi:TatD DNase family protein